MGCRSYRGQCVTEVLLSYRVQTLLSYRGQIVTEVLLSYRGQCVMEVCCLLEVRV